MNQTWIFGLISLQTELNSSPAQILQAELNGGSIQSSDSSSKLGSVRSKAQSG
jgi:hypothetical protein